jgi:hypothetical protein
LSLIKADKRRGLKLGENHGNGPGVLAMMNRFQVCAACAYAEGAYGLLASSENWRKDVDELGDGLFRYLIVELSTGEDCETWAEAIDRVETAIHELEQVSAALRAAYLDEKPNSQNCHVLRLRDLEH